MLLQQECFWSAEKAVHISFDVAGLLVSVVGDVSAFHNKHTELSKLSVLFSVCEAISSLKSCYGENRGIYGFFSTFYPKIALVWHVEECGLIKEAR